MKFPPLNGASAHRYRNQDLWPVQLRPREEIELFFDAGGITGL